MLFLRINPNSCPWQPSAGDRVCSIHFSNWQKSDDPTHPAYVLSLRMSGETERILRISDAAYFEHPSLLPPYPGATHDDKNKKDEISRFECREASKPPQQEVDHQQQAVKEFEAYFNTKHDYAAKDSDSLSPSPKRVKCDPLYIPLSEEKGIWL